MKRLEKSTEHLRSEPDRASSTVAASPAPASTEDDVLQLRALLRAAERAHTSYLAELRQGDVEPVEDWSSWYAEYLLGLR